jgi:asparagine synthase (glutamine-hydrolysing)
MHIARSPNRHRVKTMSAIFGCLNYEADPALPQRLATLDLAQAHWGPDGQGQWHDAHCALGQRLLHNTPEALHERLPRWVDSARLAITAEARIDNRDELCDQFGIPAAERPQTPDSELILRAYLRWGEAAPDRLLGDWSFAVWHPDEQRLFLARDHHGNTSLCYWQQGQGQSRRFAFASAPEALHAIGAPRRIDELDLTAIGTPIDRAGDRPTNAAVSTARTAISPALRLRPVS